MGQPSNVYQPTAELDLQNHSNGPFLAPTRDSELPLGHSNLFPGSGGGFLRGGKTRRHGQGKLGTLSSHKVAAERPEATSAPPPPSQTRDGKHVGREGAAVGPSTSGRWGRFSDALRTVTLGSNEGPSGGEHGHAGSAGNGSDSPPHHSRNPSFFTKPARSVSVTSLGEGWGPLDDDTGELSPNERGGASITSKDQGQHRHSNRWPLKSFLTTPSSAEKGKVVLSPRISLVDSETSALSASARWTNLDSPSSSEPSSSSFRFHGPPSPGAEDWFPVNSMKGPPPKAPKDKGRGKVSPKGGGKVGMTGDFLGLMSELNEQAQMSYGLDEGSLNSGVMDPVDDFEGRGAGRPMKREWSWRKMRWKKSPGHRGRQDEMLSQLEERLDRAKATLSSYSDRSPLEDAAELPEEVIPDVNVEELLLSDLPPELALPSADPRLASDALLRREAGEKEGAGKEREAEGESDEENRRSSLEREAQRSDGKSFFSILEGSSSTEETGGSVEAHHTLDEDDSLSGGAAGGMSSLLKELERMRVKAELAEKARQAAEEKAQKALAEADRSLREVEEANKRREIESAHKIEQATRGATAAMRAAEQARRIAMMEAHNTEQALAQAARTWAALEAEARKRQEVEAKAYEEEASKAKLNNYRKYSWEEIKAATDNLNPERKIGEGGFGIVYGGVLHHTAVAIKVLKNADGIRAETEFQLEVEVLGEIHHPHMVMLLGCCPEKYCLVYEFMANGSLQDRLLCIGDTPPLPWYARLRICAEIASALLVLHTRPVPIVHRDLKPANVLLDRNFVAKLGDVGLARIMPGLDGEQTYMHDSRPVGTFAYVDPEFQRTGEFGPKSDVYAFGIMLLDVLTGRRQQVYEGVEEAVDTGDVEKLSTFLDPKAGEWPVNLAMEVAVLAVRCSEMRRKKRPDLRSVVMPQLDKIRTYALAAEEEALKMRGLGLVVPSSLFCPITQEIMVNPVIAADGHTYEQAAIEQWLEKSDRSPMTNKSLPHKDLVPNHALRTMILEWRDRQLTPPPAHTLLETSSLQA